MTDEEFLLCNPVAGALGVIEGSVVLVCSQCGQDVYVAPSGIELLASKGATILCIPCGLRVLREDPEPVISPPTEAQLRELREHRR